MKWVGGDGRGPLATQLGKAPRDDLRLARRAIGGVDQLERRASGDGESGRGDLPAGWTAAGGTGNFAGRRTHRMKGFDRPAIRTVEFVKRHASSAFLRESGGRKPRPGDATMQMVRPRQAEVNNPQIHLSDRKTEEARGRSSSSSCQRDEQYGRVDGDKQEKRSKEPPSHQGHGERKRSFLVASLSLHERSAPQRLPISLRVLSDSVVPSSMRLSSLARMAQRHRSPL